MAHGIVFRVPGFPAPLCSYWSSSAQKLNTNVNPHREGGQCLSAVATQFAFFLPPFPPFLTLEDLPRSGIPGSIQGH